MVVLMMLHISFLFSLWLSLTEVVLLIRLTAPRFSFWRILFRDSMLNDESNSQLASYLQLCPENIKFKVSWPVGDTS